MANVATQGKNMASTTLATTNRATVREKRRQFQRSFYPCAPAIVSMVPFDHIKLRAAAFLAVGYSRNVISFEPRRVCH